MKYDFEILMATLVMICAMSVKCLLMKDPMKGYQKIHTCWRKALTG